MSERFGKRIYSTLQCACVTDAKQATDTHSHGRSKPDVRMYKSTALHMCTIPGEASQVAKQANGEASRHTHNLRLKLWAKQALSVERFISEADAASPSRTLTIE